MFIQNTIAKRISRTVSCGMLLCGLLWGLLLSGAAWASAMPDNGSLDSGTSPNTVDSVDADKIGGKIDISRCDWENERAPALAHNSTNDEYLVVWQDARSYSTNGYDIWGQIVRSNGSLRGSNFQIASSGSDGAFQWAPDVTYDSQDNQYLVVWGDGRTGDVWNNSEIYGQRLDADGTLLGGSLAISVAPNNQTDPAVIYNSGSQTYLVVWNDQRNGGDGDTNGRRVSKTGDLVGSEISIHNAGSFMRLAYSATDNKNLLVFTEGDNAYGRMVSGDGAVGNLFTISDANGGQGAGWAAWNSTNNEYLVVWQDTRNGSGNEDIYGQRVLKFRCSARYFQWR